MRLLRHGASGAEKPGLLDAEGRIRDLSGQSTTSRRRFWRPTAWRASPGSTPPRCRAVEGRPRLGPPLARVPNLICIGLNYADHARETNSPIPEAPIVFMKHTGSHHRPQRPGQDPARLDARPTGRSSSAW